MRSSIKISPLPAILPGNGFRTALQTVLFRSRELPLRWLLQSFLSQKSRGAPAEFMEAVFAGVIMAMLPNDLIDEYIRYIEGCLGEGCAYRMSIRPYGAVCINELLK